MYLQSVVFEVKLDTKNYAHLCSEFGKPQKLKIPLVVFHKRRTAFWNSMVHPTWKVIGESISYVLTTAHKGKFQSNYKHQQCKPW